METVYAGTAVKVEAECGERDTLTDMPFVLAHFCNGHPVATYGYNSVETLKAELAEFREAGASIELML